MRAPGHVASKTARLHGVFGGFHRTAHEHKRAFDHRRRPRRQPDALLLLVRQFAGEKTVDVVRIVGEQQKRRVDGLRLGDVHRLTRAGRFKPVEKTLVAVAWKARLGVDAVGVEGVVPHPKQRQRGHDSVVGRGVNKVLCWWLERTVGQGWAKTALLSADGLEARA